MRPLRGGRDEDDSPTLSLADLMAGLMVIFMFIAISYMRNLAKTHEAVVQQRDSMKRIADSWSEASKTIGESLDREFADSLKDWNAEVASETLTIRFKKPEVLFDVGESTLKPEFKRILGEFFPRYTALLAKHREHVLEVRIEGHTSSEWSEDMSPKQRFLENMDLSHERTLAVLTYCIGLLDDDADEWIVNRLSAAGLSSSHPILREGAEDREASRRVEFTIHTDAAGELGRILQMASSVGP